MTMRFNLATALLSQEELLLEIVRRLDKMEKEPKIVQRIMAGGKKGISLVQEAKDVDVSAIGDDKILVYKNASSKHEYEAKPSGGATDHGALTGLGDDDHTQYLLKSGGTLTGTLETRVVQPDITETRALGQPGTMWSGVYSLVGSFKGNVFLDYLKEYTAAQGIDVDGVLCKDSQVTTDQINEKTGDAGVTVDGVVCKDSAVPDAAYPNAVLKDGSRAMTGDLELVNDVILISAGGLVDFKNAAGSYRNLGYRAGYVQEGLYQVHNTLNAYLRTDYRTDAHFWLRSYDGAWRDCADLNNGSFKIMRGDDITLLAGKALYNADHIELDEITTPTAVADHGKVYTKNDNKLYFQDGAGAEHEIAFV